MTKKAWQIILEGRARIAEGFHMHTKGSGGVPRRLRSELLDKIEKRVKPKYISEGAVADPAANREREHVIPMKRIAIEIIDPEAHDPRSGGGPAKLLGPARDLEHAIEIAREMLVVALVTKDEHRRINKHGGSMQWDAPGGDGLDRYSKAGVALHAYDGRS